MCRGFMFWFVVLLRVVQLQPTEYLQSYTTKKKR